eukprot:COSAG01_NODE_12847_length_1676_cov_1.476221_2_plen_99_part_00
MLMLVVCVVVTTMLPLARPTQPRSDPSRSPLSSRRPSPHLLANPQAVLSHDRGLELSVGVATRLGRPLLGESLPEDVDWGNVGSLLELMVSHCRMSDG